MEKYLKNYSKLNNVVIYVFKLRDGGIGDYIKFFMYLLNQCIKKNIRLYILKSNLLIQDYVKLIHKKMYINLSDIKKIDNYKKIRAHELFKEFNWNFDIEVSKVFKIDNVVKDNIPKIISKLPKEYISVHLRLGDKFLETDPKYIQCKNNIRKFSEKNIYDFLNRNKDKNIIFFCDNNVYKNKIKKKFDEVLITRCKIGHTGLGNTTKEQVLDTISELLLIINSSEIYSFSKSGFPKIASKFKLVNYHEEYII